MAQLGSVLVVKTSPSTPQVEFPKNDLSGSSSTERHCLSCVARLDFTEQRHHRVTFDILPDDVLLKIFDCYIQAEVEAWHTLVHVCQNWRNLVFASPRRLNLQIVCRPTTPVREMLDAWPSFPIVIQSGCPWAGNRGVVNILAALEHTNRIRDISLRDVPYLQMGEILSGMYKPFPALTELSLQDERGEGVEEEEEAAEGVWQTINSNLFLGGSAPRLERLTLECISIPGLPKVLSSATHLVYLLLYNISYYSLSPEAMVTALSTSTRLETLILNFKCPPSRYRFWPPRDRRVCRTRTLFPALTHWSFKGDTEYLEDLVAEIDAPRVNQRIHWERDSRELEWERDREAEWDRVRGSDYWVPLMH